MDKLKWNIIDFHGKCQDCVYKDKPEDWEKCSECLSVPARSDGSHTPINFKPKK